MHMLISIILLVIASTIDTLIAGFIYGIGKIKIPFKSILVIGFTSSFIFTISIGLGTIISNYLSSSNIKIICFILLLILGIVKFSDGLIKDIIRRYHQIHKKVQFKISNLTFILTILANPEKADIDASKELSLKESFGAALAFSLDGIGVGVVAGMTNLNLQLCLLISFIGTILMLIIGNLLGKKCSSYLKHDISWISGILLIIFAFIKIMS